jgi:hypothetical protein
MPKPNRFSYKKKEPHRDAFYFILVCEGQHREVEYFKFFDKLSSRVKVVAVSAKENSAPKHLIEAAHAIVEQLGAIAGNDQLWFVMDTDKWGSQLDEIRMECRDRPNWNVAQSNPCFEVWLYFHVKSDLPFLENLQRCSQWKPYVHSIIKGGFNNDIHPVHIETAIKNAKENFRSDGYFPTSGSTQLWQLGEVLLPLIKRELTALKNLFPQPFIRD